MSFCLPCCATHQSNCTIKVHTGDFKGASTKSSVFVILYDETDQPTETYKFDNYMHDHFKSNSFDTFNVEVPTNFRRVKKLEIWHDNGCEHPNWFVELIEVKQWQYTDASIFPIFRWLVPAHGENENRYVFMEYDATLPQSDKNPRQRFRELERKRQSYQIKYVHGNIPVVKKLPSDEEFSAEYKKLLGSEFVDDFFQDIATKLNNLHWNNLNVLDDMYSPTLPKPMSANHWKEDLWFGNQRLVGCNPSLITLCTEIPEKFGVTEEMMKPVLNKKTLKGLIKKNRLFYTDLSALDGLEQNKEFQLCAPMALFMLDEKNGLLPIAIQLNQEKGPNNPVFLPTDPEYVWLLAKMWYNNADAAFHQGVLHLGWTHLLMEGVVLALQRNVSMSHPILKLLEPHTRFMLAINERAITALLAENGWINITMNVGAQNVYKLVSKFNPTWRFDLQGNPEAEFKSRKVLDPKVLPNYYFRDDSMLIYNVIRQYVKDYVQLYYTSNEVLLGDWEIQDWAKELAKDPSRGGIGMAGVPQRNGEGGFNTIEELVMVLSAVIYTGSAGHAAVNFPQYPEYSFPPNYPAQMRGELIEDKDPRTEHDLFKALPDEHTTLGIMTITNVLSSKDTNSLGDFATQYIYDPKALKIVEKFRADLRKATVKITERNKDLVFPYEVLLPENIPNAISI